MFHTALGLPRLGSELSLRTALGGGILPSPEISAFQKTPQVLRTLRGFLEKRPCSNRDYKITSCIHTKKIIQKKHPYRPEVLMCCGVERQVFFGPKCAWKPPLQAHLRSIQTPALRVLCNIRIRTALHIPQHKAGHHGQAPPLLHSAARRYSRQPQRLPRGAYGFQQPSMISQFLSSRLLRTHVRSQVPSLAALVLALS